MPPPRMRKISAQRKAGEHIFSAYGFSENFWGWKCSRPQHTCTSHMASTHIKNELESENKFGIRKQIWNQKTNLESENKFGINKESYAQRGRNGVMHRNNKQGVTEESTTETIGTAKTQRRDAPEQ